MAPVTDHSPKLNKRVTKNQIVMPSMSILGSFLIFYRVARFAILENLVFAITSKILRILMDHIEKVCSL